MLTAAGRPARSGPVSAAGDVAGYSAVVVGGALHWGVWQSEATEFVRANRAVLADSAVWLFGTMRAGPAAGGDPGEIAGLGREIGARGYRVFSAMREAGPSWLAARMIRVLPGRDARAWAEVDAWARGIAADPALAPPASSAPDRVQQPGRDDALAAWARAVEASRLSDRTAAAIEAYRHMAGPARAESALRLVDAVTAQVSPPPAPSQRSDRWPRD